TFDRLVAEAERRGIRVIVDLVPNHTSDRHPWFLDARASREAQHRDWYVWADPKSDGGPPNNWRSVFGGPAWTLDEATGQYYLHNFLAAQPDLNWWNDEVRAAFDDILRFWLDRRVAGFRIDVANGLVKDRELRDNPPITGEDHPLLRRQGLRPVYNLNRPEVHEVFRRWRTLVDAYRPDRVLLGETWVLDLEQLIPFYGSGTDQLHLAMNFPFVFADLGPAMRSVVEAAEAALPPGAWPAWHGSSHDAGRFPTRWAKGDPRKIRAALVTLLTLRGTPLLYSGDEIGMPEVDVPPDRLRDPVGLRGWPEEPGRDRARTPMPWTPTGGFTRPGVEPWLPSGDPAACNVEDQLQDPGSVLHLCRDLIALRRDRPDLALGSFAAIEAPDGVWAWRRGDTTVVAVNASDAPTELDLDGEVLLGTRPDREGARGPFDLAPWEAVVVES
ncbi:MAG TPA: alpha-amylase family glycosyl hydrolase, partial [Actinomycetota bacterium]|nr:alpha-amylase family glycosyl hydrolase [Actinomycetota bacterium]